MENLIDKHCIERLKGGSQRAFNQIYDAYAYRMYCFCMQFTKSHEDSEELVHDLFVKLWQNREKLNKELPIIRLLYHMVRNLLINRFHARVNSRSYELYTEYCDNANLSIDNTSSNIEYQDFCRQLEEIKRTMSLTQQQIVECRLNQGLSTDEIANELQLSKQTVKNQLSLALKFLREKIQESGMLGWFMLFSWIKNMF